jgi:hypothetical protein
MEANCHDRRRLRYIAHRFRAIWGG